MRFLRQSLTGLFLVSLTLGLLILAGQTIYSSVQDRMARDVRTPQDRERVFAVNVVTATPGTEQPELEVFGEILSRRTLDLRSAVGGVLIEVAENFVEGGQVIEDQVLARIDPADAQSALERAKSDLLDAQAEQRDAERARDIASDELAAAEEQSDLRLRAFQRQQDLKNRGVGTDTAVETAELAVSAARAAVLARRQSVAQAEARRDQAATRLARAGIALAEAERRLVDTTIVARFSGTLSEVSIVKGGLVSANERLARLVDPQALEVAFRVSTAQYARLLDGDGALLEAPVTVTLDVFGVDLRASGQLERDSAAVGEGQTGRLIFARLDQSRGLKPGDFVTVSIREPALENVVRLPSSALDARQRLLVLGADDRLEELAVELLRRQGNDVLVRGDGIAGREVVTARSPLLGAGIRVRPLRQTGEGPAAAQEEEELLELTEERRAALMAFVQSNQRMPQDVRSRLLEQLSQDRVPAGMVARIEGRMGG